MAPRVPGAIVPTPTCSACFGGHMGPGENAVSNTNRNFKGRKGSSEAGVHLANAYVAAAVAGEIRIDTDSGEIEVCGERFETGPIPPFMAEMVSSGGLIHWVREKLTGRGEGG